MQTSKSSLRPRINRRPTLLYLLLFSFFLSAAFGDADGPPPYIWQEGQDFEAGSQVTRHPWYSRVKTEPLSGGAFASHWSADQPGKLIYSFEAPQAGDHALWLRVNPQQSRMTFALNDAPAQSVPMDRAMDRINIAADDKPDLRFLAWVPAGEFSLREGQNRIVFTLESDNHHHGMLDAFVFVREAFAPAGAAKPDQAHAALLAAAGEGWHPWMPHKDPHHPSPIDLRRLNESEAGENGRIVARNGEFVHADSGEAVRFWAVNGPSRSLEGEDLQHALRALAKRGVNLIRFHGAVFDKHTGTLREEDVAWIQELVTRAKAEGIYTHLSIYFPLWFEPGPDVPFLQGYDGNRKPFAALFFNKDFEAHYQNWWRVLLTRPNPHHPEGAPLMDDPALFGVEIVNEDSFFFWTFAERNLPEAQRAILETQFHDWVLQKHGSVEAAYQVWGGRPHRDDQPEARRLAFRTLWDIFTHKTPRDRDTTEFLAQTQRAFYQRQVDFLEDLGYKGMVTASNWHTANDRIFRPLEIWTYLPGDFIDRHGYFGVWTEGEHTAWSIRPGHQYAHRSALRFESREPGGGLDFRHPVADPKYNHKPSMISETTWNRPNRHRGEAPLFYAAYASLQGSNSIVHFAHDGPQWSVKPGFWMQPWTLMSPTQMGQFPATALLYRKGYIAEGETLARVHLSHADLLQLRGTPLVQAANLDELRLPEVEGQASRARGTPVAARSPFRGKTAVHCHAGEA
ncbi:MAG: hypothetical protein JJU29_12280, partial [Verrucomicrobia bacterium]|nr:hypothetical protein [Verrucomicrobiota bacterium]